MHLPRYETGFSLFLALLGLSFNNSICSYLTLTTLLFCVMYCKRPMNNSFQRRIAFRNLFQLAEASVQHPRSVVQMNPQGTNHDSSYPITRIIPPSEKLRVYHSSLDSRASGNQGHVRHQHQAYMEALPSVEDLLLGEREVNASGRGE